MDALLRPLMTNTGLPTTQDSQICCDYPGISLTHASHVTDSYSLKMS